MKIELVKQEGAQLKCLSISTKREKKEGFINGIERAIRFKFVRKNHLHCYLPICFQRFFLSILTDCIFVLVYVFSCNMESMKEMGGGGGGGFFFFN